MDTKTIEKIIEFFEENGDIFGKCIEELDAYNGYLVDERHYQMDEIDEIFCGADPSYLLMRAFNGYDADNYITDSYGRKEYQAFNPNRNYFKINGYGNLVSTDYKDYSAFLGHYAVEAMAKNIAYIDTVDRIPELKALFEEVK